MCDFPSLSLRFLSYQIATCKSLGVCWFKISIIESPPDLSKDPRFKLIFDTNAVEASQFTERQTALTHRIIDAFTRKPKANILLYGYHKVGKKTLALNRSQDNVTEKQRALEELKIENHGLWNVGRWIQCESEEFKNLAERFRNEKDSSEALVEELRREAIVDTDLLPPLLSQPRKRYP